MAGVAPSGLGLFGSTGFPGRCPGLMSRAPFGAGEVFGGVSRLAARANESQPSEAEDVLPRVEAGLLKSPQCGCPAAPTAQGPYSPGQRPGNSAQTKLSPP